MSAEFDRSILHVLEHEGGLVDDPDDPGGATNWGWSLRTLKTLGDEDGDGWLDGDLDHDGDVDADDIRLMSRADAIQLYRDQWWDRYNYHLYDYPISSKLFDLAVNMGHQQAAKILQRSAGAVLGGIVLVDDGILGSKSRGVILELDPAAMRYAMRSEAAGFYRGLIMAKPVRRKYRRGWLRRAYW